MSDLSKLAERLEKKGRKGDSTLLHVNKEELKTLEALLGEITVNPETGLPEAFSWKKLLAGLAMVGGAAAIAFTGGAAAPFVVPMMASAGFGTAVGSIFDKGKEKSTASEAANYADERAAKRKEGHYNFAPPMRTISSPVQPDLYGRQTNNYVQSIAPMGNRNQLAMLADNVDASTDNSGLPSYRRPYAAGGKVTEESAKKQVLAILAQLKEQQEAKQQQGIGGMAQQQPPPMMPMQQGMMPQQGMPMMQHGIGQMMPQMAHGRMVKGAGAGLDDMIPANLSDGEYVVPADVVSMMGDGSTDAGGRRLDGLMAKVRMEKTGSKKQAGRIKGLHG